MLKMLEPILLFGGCVNILMFDSPFYVAMNFFFSWPIGRTTLKIKSFEKK